MSKKKSAGTVEKTDRGFRIRPCVLYLSAASGGPGTNTYACAEYEIRWWEAEVYHSKVDQGPPVYVYDHPDLELAFLVARAAMAQIRARADGRTGSPEWRQRVKDYLDKFGKRDEDLYP